MKKIILILLVFLTTTIGCKKEELPPATQEGANTFGCKINGVTYFTKGKWEYRMIVFSSGVKAEYLSDQTMWIFAAFTNPDIEEVYFKFKYDGSLGKYTDIVDAKKNTNSYIKITRYDNEIISGVFDVTLEKSINGNMVTTRYSDGRFDIKLNN